jgi:hypothetical protein
MWQLQNRRHLGVRVQCRQIQFQMQIPRVGTKNVLCLSVQVHIVAAGSLSQTVCRNDFLIPIGADFRNLNLPALYAYLKTSYIKMVGYNVNAWTLMLQFMLIANILVFLGFQWCDAAFNASRPDSSTQQHVYVTLFLSFVRRGLASNRCPDQTVLWLHTRFWIDRSQRAWPITTIEACINTCKAEVAPLPTHSVYYEQIWTSLC